MTSKSATRADLVPGRGKALVGLAVRSSQAPVTGLHPGDQVLIVFNAGQAGGGSAGKPVQGKVFAVGSVGSDGTHTVDVIVDEAWPQHQQRAGSRSSSSLEGDAGMLIALVSGKGSPGTSTTALALAMKWPRPALLAELDPRGGEVRLGYGQGTRTDGRGLVLLQDENRGAMATRLWEEVLGLEGYPDRFWLPGVERPRHGVGLLPWSLTTLVDSPGTSVLTATMPEDERGIVAGGRCARTATLQADRPGVLERRRRTGRVSGPARPR